MTSKADFNAEEWTTVVEGPVLAGLRVVPRTWRRDHPRERGRRKVYAAARQAQGESELLDALVSSPPGVDTQQVRAGGDLATVSSERLREALRILRDKATPEEVDQFKRFVMEVAEAAAKAHKEGGFIGIGGKPISAEEQVALDEIQAVLDA